MLRTVSALAVFGAVALTLAAPARAADPKTDDEKTLYVMGVMLSRQVGQFGLSAAELAFVQDGLSDAVLGKKPKADPQTYGPKIQALAQSRQTALAQKEKDGSKPFLDKAAQEKGAEKLASGVIYRETKAGSGASPKSTDRVKVHYHGTLRDGSVFDSSKERGEPATFPLNGVIKCWTEGVQKMKVGGTARLTCPSDTAYGDRGAPPKIKPGAALSFDVELLEIVAPATPPAAKPGDEKKN
jgi:FKBP-type peptidyl-prolyl cis-trans isomerase FkpA